MTADQQSEGPALRRTIAHVELVGNAEKRALVQRMRKTPMPSGLLAKLERSTLDPARYRMAVTLAADLDDGRRVTVADSHFSFGGPSNGLSVADVEHTINQTFGSDSDRPRSPEGDWWNLLDVLARVGTKTTEEELIALPLKIELSDQVKAYIARD